MTYDEIKAKLSPQQWRIFTLLGCGYSVSEIADTLEISMSGCSTQLYRMLSKKLGGMTRYQAGILSYKLGLIRQLDGVLRSDLPLSEKIVRIEAILDRIRE